MLCFENMMVNTEKLEKLCRENGEMRRSEEKMVKEEVYS